MGSQARSILRDVMKEIRGNYIDYRLVTAHLGCGMWWRYPNEEELFNEKISQPKERVLHYFLNDFKHLLNEKLLSKNFQTIWDTDKTSHE